MVLMAAIRQRTIDILFAAISSLSMIACAGDSVRVAAESAEPQAGNSSNGAAVTVTAASAGDADIVVVNGGVAGATARHLYRTFERGVRTFCLESRGVPVNVKLYGTEELLHLDNDGCAAVELEAGLYTLEVSSANDSLESDVTESFLSLEDSI